MQAYDSIASYTIKLYCSLPSSSGLNAGGSASAGLHGGGGGGGGNWADDGSNRKQLVASKKPNINRLSILYDSLLVGWLGWGKIMRRPQADWQTT